MRKGFNVDVQHSSEPSELFLVTYAIRIFFMRSHLCIFLFVAVCKHIITRILDVPDYDMEKSRPNFVMTLHQFMSYFNDEGGLKHVEAVALESKFSLQAFR